jgi:branched-chain amino acid transport system substrate-binding protein
MADMDSNKKDEEGKGLLTGKEISRRDFLKVAGAAGATIGMATGLGSLVAACEDKDTGTSVSVTEVEGVETGREVKIGFVTPLTGPIASFGVPDQYCAERAAEAYGDGIVCGDGKKHPIKIITYDSQSDTNRAAQVTGDLINNDGVDLVVTASTPDTVAPVADQCEAYGVPCISNDCPWQSYIATRSQGDITATFKWTYHTFWGLEDVQANFLDMWTQVPNNGVVAAMFPNDADGNAWQPGWAPVWEPNNLQPVDLGLYPNFSEDYTAQISEFKKQGCEIGMGVFLPPDFTNFWKQRAQQGWVPKLGTYAKALLFPESIEALGDIGAGLTTEVWWMPTHPFSSALLGGETCQQFADEYTSRTGGQWTQPLLHFIIFEHAWDALKRATSVDDKEAILAAVKTTKMDTIGGHIDFTAPVVGPTPPFQVGPCHIVENVYKTPQVGGQWRKGTDYPYELTVCSNAAVPDGSIPTQDTVQELTA